MKKRLVGGGKVYAFFQSIFFALSITMVTAVPCVMANETINDPVQAKFLKAMEERDKGNLYEALDIFSNILTNQPLLHRARLELAVTFYRLYDYEEARRQAQQVLDDPSTPANVRVTILAFIAQIDKDAAGITAQKHYWRPTAALGWMHDTNVNAGPDSEIVNTDIGIAQLSPGATARSDSAVLLIGSLNHRYQPGKTFRAGKKNAVLLWQSQASYYRRDYFDEHDFDLDVATIGTGPAFVAIGAWRANLNLQVDYIGLGGDELAWFYSILPSFTKQYRNGSIEWTLDGTITERDYRRDVDAGRDNTYYALQFSVGKRFNIPSKLNIQIGGSVFTEDADTDQWTNDGHEIYLGASIEPWTDGNIYGRINETNAYYDGPADGFTTNREDRETRYTAGISHTFRYRWLDEWTLTGNFIRTENSSNASTYDYDREQVSVLLSKTF